MKVNRASFVLSCILNYSINPLNVYIFSRCAIKNLLIICSMNEIEHHIFLSDFFLGKTILTNDVNEKIISDYVIH